MKSSSNRPWEDIQKLPKIKMYKADCEQTHYRLWPLFL